MRTIVRLGTYLAAVSAVFTATWGIGQAVGDPPPEPAAGHDDGGHDDTGHGDAGHGDSGSTTEPPGGLQISQDGYTFHLMEAPATAGAEATLAFHILGPDGHPVTEFDIAHEKPLHLIVANRALTEFHHVHPEMSADGLWTIPLALDRAGAYRAFADFVPTGANPLTLGADVLVAGDATADPMPATAPTATVDGYDVTLDGALAAGTSGELGFTVTRDGETVELEPYLGANGHLVVLRAGDLAYLHAHPEDGGAGPAVSFHTTAPSPGTYRLFLDFQVAGVVRTAAFTVEVASHEH